MISNLFKGKSASNNTEASAQTEAAPNGISLKISGQWLLASKRPSTKGFIESLSKQNPKALSFDAAELESFDSSFIAFLTRVYDYCAEKNVKLDIESLPEKPKALLKLAVAVPSKQAKRKIVKRKTISERLQTLGLNTFRSFKEQFGFFGELVVASIKMFSGKARVRKSDMFFEVERAGPDALPIVGLIAFLVGLILAFVGANILAQYGAETFVADLVGLAMVREMGVIMVGIVMAGRTGAAYAAELGSMKINEEIAAFRTFGISPLEFLVLPRILALVAMFPLLTIFADFIGMLGGFVISSTMFDINYDAYMNRTLASLTLTHCATGVFKSFFFGIIVAVVGCMKGMTCGNSAEAVGNATTSSVVTSITLIIVADAVFAVFFNIFNI